MGWTNGCRDSDRVDQGTKEHSSFPNKVDRMLWRHPNVCHTISVRLAPISFKAEMARGAEEKGSDKSERPPLLVTTQNCKF